MGFILMTLLLLKRRA